VEEVTAKSFGGNILWGIPYHNLDQQQELTAM